MFRCAMRFVASRSRACSVGLERLGVFAELGQRLAQPVAGVDVRSELEELAVRCDRRLPFAARRVRDRGIGQLSALSGRRVSFSKRHERCEHLRIVTLRPRPAESAPLYHRPRTVSTRAPAGALQGRCRNSATTTPRTSRAPYSAATLRPDAGPRRASTAPDQV